MAARKRPAIIALFAVAACGAVSAALAADALNTDSFISACVEDPVVKDEPGFNDGSSVTPQIYCECVAGKFAGAALSQTDVDMLVKMHRDEITDEDAEGYVTLEDLMQANEAIEDECKKSLGMPSFEDNGDEEGPPFDEEEMPQDE